MTPADFPITVCIEVAKFFFVLCVVSEFFLCYLAITCGTTSHHCIAPRHGTAPLPYTTALQNATAPHHTHRIAPHHCPTALHHGTALHQHKHSCIAPQTIAPLHCTVLHCTPPLECSHHYYTEPVQLRTVQICVCEAFFGSVVLLPFILVDLAICISTSHLSSHGTHRCPLCTQKNISHRTQNIEHRTQTTAGHNSMQYTAHSRI